ncbi:MAG TPA: filamentous hemagglutinin N-terminal domain-containing protein, partial [Vicinamibacterales bacterium]|nr:filamentous hemagglutinin N-terminal domain-containing protein [Vicinamibacterales bacterium]
MKNRPTWIARTADRRRREFAFHPLSFAICLGFSGAALAAPQGGTVVAGQATITQPTPTSQVINQTTNKAIIDWKSFSIATGEKVRFNQPSTTSVTLNRVTGYDPSYILGDMSANGKIFLVNPYGVVFGANARIDVGGLVATTLSLANSDFLAGRYSLTSVDAAAPAQRGEVRNEGTISAPGGTVVLAGPTVSNTGTIVANGGRVGLVAANAVSVDVEGDGLLFFQTSATEAKNRLEQLGRIQADGGSIEMRAAARGAFADTVLNMAGVVQAKSIGTRGGKIVIDGGGDGIVRVAGQLDATGLGAGERGGSVTVEGQRVLVDAGSVVDASGVVGGGAIRVGGDFHGANPGIRNAEATVVAAGAVLRADAVDQGQGGSVAIWSDGLTRYQGSISARGGERGGDGGFVEVSGKQSLVYDGKVDTRAPKGATGTLLLDPTDITIDESVAENPTIVNTAGVFTDPTTSPSNIKASTLTGQLATTAVIVDTTSALPGTGTITIKSDVIWGNANNLTFKALSNLTLNAGAQLRNNSSGDLSLQANGAVLLNGSVSLGSGDLFVSNFAGATTGPTGAASFTTGAAGTITTAGGNVTIRTIGDVALGAAVVTNGAGGATPGNAGNVTITAADGAISTGALTANGGVGTTIAGGAVGGKGGDISLTVDGSGHALSTGAISALGGKGSDNSTNNSDGRTGGAGGAVTLANLSGGTSTVGAIT